MIHNNEHKRQNVFINTDLFDRILMFTYRNWVHDQHKEDVKFTLSTFAYFSNYKIIQTFADEIAQLNNEICFSVAVALKHEILKGFSIVD